MHPSVHPRLLGPDLEHGTIKVLGYPYHIKELPYLPTFGILQLSRLDHARTYIACSSCTRTGLHTTASSQAIAGDP